jgi:hypothetical protein
MKSQGICITDKIGHVISVELQDILEEVHNGEEFHWSILFLEVMGDLGEERPVPEFEKQIHDLENGFFINWKDLNTLVQRFEQLINITLLGCKDPNLLQRYEDDQEMYETCDITIEFIDSTYWQVFSKDKKLIDRLAAKFKEIEFLETDYLEQFLNRKSQGILIFDKKNEVEPVDFSDVFAVINIQSFYWRIFYLEAEGSLGKEDSIFQLEKQINESEKGFSIQVEGIDSFMKQFQKIINLTLIAERDSSSIKRYENDQKMYEAFEIVVQMINNSYWKIFSKDEKIIDSLANKFKDINFVEPNSQVNYL